MRLLPDQRALPLAVALLVGTAAVWSSALPVLRPLTHRRALSAAAVLTPAGVPVPAEAHRCAGGPGTAPGAERWCLPSGVGPRAVARWYAGVLPAGRSRNGLTWCLAEVQSDGSRRALWSDAGGLVGYQLAGTDLLPGARTRGFLAVLSFPGQRCPAIATRGVA